MTAAAPKSQSGLPTSCLTRRQRRCKRPDGELAPARRLIARRAAGGLGQRRAGVDQAGSNAPAVDLVGGALEQALDVAGGELGLLLEQQCHDAADVRRGEGAAAEEVVGAAR